MQKGGDNGSHIDLIIGQNTGDLERVGKIRVSRQAGLGAMHLHGENVRAVKRLLVGAGVIGFDPFDEFELSDHGIGPPATLILGLMPVLVAGPMARKRNVFWAQERRL